ncbi:unnamed protein product [Echinostoma caproni]|uniref:RPN13_C domain-containing protein n=1 Tax=Echinostoma caproni TaxID=27848 RepID=A0A183A329_9TREM|nr:unnamed protein product [Echinostoma caproni]
MPKISDPEKSQEEEPTVGFGTLGTMLSQLLALLSSVVRGGQVYTQLSPSLPPPNKFSLSDDFRRWAADAQEYVELFTPSDRRRVLFSLLEGEAKDIARDVIRPGAGLQTPEGSTDHTPVDNQIFPVDILTRAGRLNGETASIADNSEREPSPVGMIKPMS